VPGLQRYLIIFDPLAFVLDQQGLPGWLLSPLVVFPRSQNFTSRVEVRPAPSAPIDRDPFALLKISVLHESPLGHLRYGFRCAAPAKLPT